jgi:hypothetical protein
LLVQAVEKVDNALAQLVLQVELLALDDCGSGGSQSR